MVDRANNCPGPGHRIVQFRALVCGIVLITPGDDEDLAIGQQVRCVLKACDIEAARGSPGSALRIIQFRAR